MRTCPRRRKNDGEPKRVVFYIRFSSWQQDAENSKEGQLNALQDYADSNGKICVGIYIDEAISGKRDDRMELNRLMRDGQSRDRPFDEVLIWKFDRFGRRASTIDRRATDLESLDIAVTAIRQPIDGKPAVVRFVRNLLGNISEYFSDNMGEDIARRTENLCRPWGLDQFVRPVRTHEGIPDGQRPDAAVLGTRSQDRMDHRAVVRHVPRWHRDLKDR